jgi:hypothetical protein
MEPTVELAALLEYRMRAVAIGHLALRYSMSWERPPAMAVYFDKKQVIEGTATGFTNAAIEAAIVHCRALLEFGGLVAGATAISLREVSLPRRRTDDHGIEQFNGLCPISIAEAVAYYPGAAAEAESALAYVIYLANKGLAHTTSSFTQHDNGTRLLEIAFRGVPELICNRFYIARGVEPPDYKLPKRERAD